RFGYLTGWRSGEIKALRWERVDRQGKEIRLATSKNGRGRVLALDGEILDVIERRWKLREYITREGISGLCDYVFHRQGRPVADFRKRWEKACEDAKLPGRLFGILAGFLPSLPEVGDWASLPVKDVIAQARDAFPRDVLAQLPTALDHV